MWPGYHNQGIGQRLLELCLSPENALALDPFIVISDSIDLDSNALYGKYGMYQYVPLPRFEGRVSAQLDITTKLRTMPFILNDAPWKILAELDRHVLGVERSMDHTMWLTQPDLTGYLLLRMSTSLAIVMFRRRALFAP